MAKIHKLTVMHGLRFWQMAKHQGVQCAKYAHYIMGGVLIIGLAACSSSESVLKGERIDIIKVSDQILVDPAALAEGAGLSTAFSVVTAGQPGLNAGHAGGNVTVELPLEKRWQVSIGGSGNKLTELAQPVVGDNQVYTVSPDGRVSAFDSETGKPNWQVSIETLSDDPLPGTAGGLAFGNGQLFAHAGARTLAAISPSTGTLKWSVSLDLPIRGGPTLIAGQAVSITDIDGNVHTYTTADGGLLWERAGLPANTVVFGAPSPAFAGDQIVVAGYGGDVSVLDATSGSDIWTDTLAAYNPRTPMQGIGDITAHPVHDGGLIFVVSQVGQISAYNARSGLVVWSKPIGGNQMPWVSGKSLFVLTIDGRLYALRRSDGALRWVVELPGALPTGVVASESIVPYVGPFVVSDKVMVISRKGTLLEFDADTGARGGDLNVGKDVVTAPQLANGSIFVLGNNGTLTAFD